MLRLERRANNPLGDILFLLKTELHGPQGQRILSSLSCPETELTLWLAAANGQLKPNRLRSLLRRSPTLFLIAASRANACSGSPVQSMDQLVSRLKHCFGESCPIETALGHIVEFSEIDDASIAWPVETLDCVDDFLQAKKRKPFVKSLAKLVCKLNKRFLKPDQCVSKPKTRGLIETMLVDSFRIERQKVDSSWRQTNRWPGSELNCDSESCRSAILGLLNAQQTVRFDFADRLHNAKLSAMKQLAYGASHEINNPLANIATRAQTMLSSESDPDRRFQLAVMHEQAMRAHDMISDMMLFAHPPALRCEMVDVRKLARSLIRECEANLLPLIRCGAQLSVIIGPNIGLADLDPTQCKVAIGCLIQNAAEAIRDDFGEIELRIQRRQSDLCFEVTDNGVGIDEAVQQHLFDPFYSGREAGRGLGFGLSKSWRIAKLHGGSLTHRLDKKLRTVFEFRLPQQAGVFWQK